MAISRLASLLVRAAGSLDSSRTEPTSEKSGPSEHGLERRVAWPGTKLQKHGAGDPNHNRHWRQRALADEQEQHRGGQSGTARKQRRQPRTPAAERARLDVVELLVEHRSAQAPRLKRL